MANARLQIPSRTQLRLTPHCLDDLVQEDHPVRLVWAHVERLDLAVFHAKIRAVAGHPGRPPIDPRLLLALWLYATTQGVTSAREVARLCEDHVAYRWLCGDVSVNYHTLSDFRSNNEEEFESLLVQHLTALLSAGVVTLETVLQDGVRVRASAGSASFRTDATLEEQLAATEAHLRSLRQEQEADPGAATRRQRAARERVAAERKARLEDARTRAAELAEIRKRSMGHKSLEEQKEMKRKIAKGEVRASTTDPDAHRMKMADGGFRPAYNGQLAMEPASRVIVGVRLTNDGLDGAQLPPMEEHLRRTLGRSPRRMVADGGFANHASIETLAGRGVTVFTPVDRPRNGRDPHLRLKGDSPAIGDWRERMGTEGAKAVFGLRPLVEWGFARFRNWNLRQFRVRGLKKCQSVFTLFALVHNFVLAHEGKVVVSA
jgi:transposase